MPAKRMLVMSGMTIAKTKLCRVFSPRAIGSGWYPVSFSRAWIRSRVAALIRSWGSLFATRDMVAGWTPARAASSFRVAKSAGFGERSRARRTSYRRSPILDPKAGLSEDDLARRPPADLLRVVDAYVHATRLISDQRRGEHHAGELPGRPRGRRGAARQLEPPRGLFQDARRAQGARGRAEDAPHLVHQ